MEIIVKNVKIPLKYATNFKDKLIGFMFCKKRIDYCICFKNTRSIHTFFMYQNIDIIMTDRDNNIVSIYNNIKKNKVIIGNRKVYYTYELPLNVAKNFKLGEKIKIRSI